MGILARRKLWVTVVAVLIAAAAAGCGSSSGSRGAGSGGSGSKGPYKIGLVSTLSTSAAPFGKSVNDGANLAIDQINAHGGVNGHKLEAVAVDDQNNPELAVSQFTKMVSINHIGAAISLGSPNLLALAPLAARYKVPLINPAAIDPTIADPKKYTLTTINTAAQEAKVMVQYLKQHLPNIRSAAILVDSSAIGVSAAKAFTSAFEAAGGKVTTSQQYAFGAVDFRTELSKIAATHPQAVYTDAQVPGVANMFREASQLGLKTQWLGDTLFGQLSLASVGQSANGMILTAPDVNVAKGSGKAFFKAFEAKYHTYPQAEFADTAYSAVQLIASVAKKVGWNGSDLLKGMLNAHNARSLIGPMNFNSDGDVTLPLLVNKIENGKFVVQGKY